MFRCKMRTLEQRVPVIFPEFMVHHDVAEVFRYVLKVRHKFTEVEPVSAGFFSVDSGECHGESETLALKASEDDGVTIRTYGYTHGQV
jgi:hypothetical protein